jgi:hypothetical protein
VLVDEEGRDLSRRRAEEAALYMDSTQGRGAGAEGGGKRRGLVAGWLAWVRGAASDGVRRSELGAAT